MHLDRLAQIATQKRYFWPTLLSVAAIASAFVLWPRSFPYPDASLLPARAVPSPDKIALGKRLFLDPRLSADNTIACASCHDLANAGTDGLALPTGIGGVRGHRNAPTVFDAALNFRQFWDGLDAQIDEHIADPTVMGASWAQIVPRLTADQRYYRQFDGIYADGITPANIRDAIAGFERSLSTSNSRFQRWRLGEQGALSATEQGGYRRFVEYGCIACHQGRGFGGNLYQKLGVVIPYFDENSPLVNDYGRFAITGDPEHKFVYKVPSLLHVARTAPYLHDGSVQSLDAAVRLMARHQLGLAMPEQDVQAIVAFLQTLTGEYDGTPL